MQSPAGTAADKLRLALVWLLTCESVPPEAECQQVEGLLGAAGADMAAWSYVKRMRRLNLTGKQQLGSASVSEGLGGFGGAAQSQLTTLLGTTFGQGLSSLTKGAPGSWGRNVVCRTWQRLWVGCADPQEFTFLAEFIFCLATNGHVRQHALNWLIYNWCTRPVPLLACRREEFASGGAAGSGDGGDGSADGRQAKPRDRGIRSI